MLVIQRRFSNVIIDDVDVAPTIEAAMGEGGGNVPIIISAIGIDCYNQCITGDKAMSIRAKAADNDHIPCAIVGGCGVWTRRWDRLM